MGASSSSPTDTMTKEDFIKTEIGSHQVVVFSKTYCPYCTRTKDLFGQAEFSDVDVVTYELDKRKDGPAIQATLTTMSGQRTVPSVWIGGKFLGGNSETQSAYASGELQKMLQSS
mmetsp:Transcript_14233/g.29718  ORF Transcript_14233/g.29718 Transcript_14233/m.29718 type:complete len:115 (-) Transcript_14233:2751-3095(-)